MTRTNKLYMWGNNDNGRLCNLERQEQSVPYRVLTEQHVVDVFCGPRNTFVINDSNEVMACGDNSYGQLGVGRSEEEC